MPLDAHDNAFEVEYIFILKKRCVLLYVFFLPACKCIHVGTLPMRRPEEAIRSLQLGLQTVASHDMGADEPGPCTRAANMLNG